jgi:hypothetical protein
LQYLVRNRIVIVSSSWTAEWSVAMRFGRPQSTLYLIMLTRHQIHSQLRKGCVWVAPWRYVPSVLWCWLTQGGKMRLVMYVCIWWLYTYLYVYNHWNIWISSLSESNKILKLFFSFNYYFIFCYFNTGGFLGFIRVLSLFFFFFNFRETLLIHKNVSFLFSSQLVKKTQPFYFLLFLLIKTQVLTIDFFALRNVWNLFTNWSVKMLYFLFNAYTYLLKFCNFCEKPWFI